MTHAKKQNPHISGRSYTHLKAYFLLAGKQSVTATPDPPSPLLGVTQDI